LRRDHPARRTQIHFLASPRGCVQPVDSGACTPVADPATVLRPLARQRAGSARLPWGRRAPPPGPLSSPLIHSPLALVPLYSPSCELTFPCKPKPFRVNQNFPRNGELATWPRLPNSRVQIFSRPDGAGRSGPHGAFSPPLFDAPTNVPAETHHTGRRGCAWVRVGARGCAWVRKEVSRRQQPSRAGGGAQRVPCCST
jgi:hypothetical protein